MARDPDAGLVKRGFALLALMLLLVVSVLFIIFQGPRRAASSGEPSPESFLWTVAVPTAPFPAAVAWGAMHELGQAMPSPVGWEIRQNAVAALVRRGSDQVPWALFLEMLDVRRMAVNLRAQTQDGQESPEASARELVIANLKALTQWHEKRRAAHRTDRPDGLTAVYAVVDRLAESPDPALREQARKTQQSCFRG